MPFLALDAEAHNVAFVEVELCVVVAPDVDLFVFFTEQESEGGGVQYPLGLGGKLLGRMIKCSKWKQRGDEQVCIWKEEVWWDIDVVEELG
jgi:hypothetical protein